MNGNLKGRLVGKYLDAIEYVIVPILHRSTKDLCVVKNLKYGEGPREELDVIYKKDGIKKPLLIYIHGGGFISGVRKMRTYICADYARAGYVVVNVEYELAPRQKFPYQLGQLFKAIEYVRDNAEKYDIDLSKIVIAGESAGAYFASYVSAIIKDETLYKRLGINFKYVKEMDVYATILLNGCYSAKNMCSIKFPNMPTFIQSFFGITKKQMLGMEAEELAIFSSLDQIGENYPFTVVGRSKADGLDAESIALIEKLKEKKVPHVQFMAGGINSPHGWCLATFTKEGKRCLEITLNAIK
ncbi:MAG: alpha/beta hydrolase [Clostridia bacterium]|nr:alpha/beta hydrolase [Clostridia bacterium]